MNNIKILDCTLRDGGYVNDWHWGIDSTKDIIKSLTNANIDMVEVGFLRNIDEYDPNYTLSNTIEELNKLLPKNKKNTMYTAMSMCSNYDVNKLSEYSGEGIELIRITAHDYDIQEGLNFAQCVKNKGYKVAINPINIMGYTDKEILNIVEKVNTIQPYQFTIVDTFGSMKIRDLDRLVRLVDNNLNRDIILGLHLHENCSMSVFLAQQFLNLHLSRTVVIDASLMGMGRIPGNLPIELIADYVNENFNKNYNLDTIMDAIEEHIMPLKGETKWGYTPAYFLSAKYNLHRNYAEHLLDKGDLTNRDINYILSTIDHNKKTVFDAKYIDNLYNKYQSRTIDDTQYRNELINIFMNRNILILAPGYSLNTYENDIKEYIDSKKPIVISLNFISDKFNTDYAFFSNNKRYDKIDHFDCKVIVTSNIDTGKADYVINYNRVIGTYLQGCNSLIMLLTFLSHIDVANIIIAGADGYSNNKNYYSDALKCTKEDPSKFNIEVSNAIKDININIEFLTPTLYNLKEN